MGVAEVKTGPAGAGELSAAPADVAVEERGAGGRVVSERLANVERLRLVAMFEIVAFHVSGAIHGAEQRLPLIAGLGLPTFLLLNNAFNCTLSERMGTRAFLNVKVSRLLLPWLIWSALYALVVLLEKLRHDESVADAFSAWMIVGGTYDHLWFVPFALFGSLLIAWLQARTRTVSHTLMLALMLAVGAVVVVAGALVLETRAIEWPALQWLFALPSPLLGFALGRVVLSKDRPLLARSAALLSALAVVCVASSWVWPVPEMVRRYAASMALVSLAFLWPSQADRFSRHLTPLLFGVYLIHPLFVRVYQAAHLPALPLALLAVIVFAASAAAVEVLRRGPLRRLV